VALGSPDNGQQRSSTHSAHRKDSFSDFQLKVKMALPVRPGRAMMNPVNLFSTARNFRCEACTGVRCIH
jgi:hypothetical protein